MIVDFVPTKFTTTWSELMGLIVGHGEDGKPVDSQWNLFLVCL